MPIICLPAYGFSHTIFSSTSHSQQVRQADIVLDVSGIELCDLLETLEFLVAEAKGRLRDVPEDSLRAGRERKGAVIVTDGGRFNVFGDVSKEKRDKMDGE